VIAEKNLANGLAVSIVDHSRPLAADRWYVKVVGHLNLTVRSEDYPLREATDTELERLARERLGDCLEHQLVRERNFVDGAGKDELIGQLTTQLMEVVSRYLNDENFPARLFALKYRESLDLCRVARGKANIFQEEDNEPADFSHCFK
jgi:hypothetical protein